MEGRGWEPSSLGSLQLWEESVGWRDRGVGVRIPPTAMGCGCLHRVSVCTVLVGVGGSNDWPWGRSLDAWVLFPSWGRVCRA